jgi:general secretion pathway protein K
MTPPQTDVHASSNAARVCVRARRRRREQGIALVMVMGAIAVLAVVLADFQDDASTEQASATADRDSVQAEYMARSAVNLSRLLIASEPTIRQAIAPLFMLMKRTAPQLPVWEYSDRLLGAFNDSEASADFARTTGADVSLGKNLGMPGGRFEVKIVDEDSKINANLGASNDIAHIRLAKELMGLMMPPQFNPLFEQKDSTGNFHDRMAICQAVIDWADVDERQFSCDIATQTAQGGGLEGAWYQQIPKPYRMKNAPYDSLEELRMVRGIGDDFWSTFIEPDATRPDKRVVTVWGQGKVNVNSANAQTLLGLVCAGAPLAEVCTDIQQAQAFLTGVTMARGITMGAPLFGNAKEFIATMKGEGMVGPLLTSLLGMKAVKFQSEGDFSNSITTESKMFSIYAVGIVKGYKRETRSAVHAVVDFRNAPGLAASGGPPSGSPPGSPNPPQSATAAAASDYANAMRPSTGGTVVHYRID